MRRLEAHHVTTDFHGFRHAPEFVNSERLQNFYPAVLAHGAGAPIGAERLLELVAREAAHPGHEVVRKRSGRRPGTRKRDAPHSTVGDTSARSRNRRTSEPIAS